MPKRFRSLANCSARSLDDGAGGPVRQFTGQDQFADKVLSAVREQFGGHAALKEGIA